MKLTNQNIIVLLAVAILLGIPGCAHYKARTLNKLAITTPEQKEESSISMSYRIFDKSDCKQYLDRDILVKGYQPIQITLINNTKRHLNFSLKNFSIPCASPEEVAAEVHTSTSKRAISYGVAALFIWPFIIPAIIDGLGSSDANKKLDRDFDTKALHDQVVLPYSTVNGLIFVPRDQFNLQFRFSVTDANNNDHFVLGSTNRCIKA